MLRNPEFRQLPFSLHLSTPRSAQYYQAGYSQMALYRATETSYAKFGVHKLYPIYIQMVYIKPSVYKIKELDLSKISLF